MRLLIFIICSSATLCACFESLPCNAQSQACPLNNSFALGTLTHWYAYTGNNANGNNDQFHLNYDSTVGPPSGTDGTVAIQEYNLPSVNGIQVLTNNGSDPFGHFSTIPNINGYQYSNSVLLGSTSISHSNAPGMAGGYVRGISYRIDVPPGPPSEPYTMTYAYAMVLENGTHNSNEQPMIKATLSTTDSIITCASPTYLLPTLNNASTQGTGATLDSGAAYAEGFTPSTTPSPNENPNSATGGHLYDVWWKGWTEVTFDLAPYRGQQVVLTFEADNCVPGGHFAYAYFAMRNSCAGLLISGDSIACTTRDLTYSVPTLLGATYTWSVPPGWNVVSGADTSFVTLDIGTGGGLIIAHEVNGCANLMDTLKVSSVPPTIPGAVLDDTTVCAGTNNHLLSLTGQRGSVVGWLSTADGFTFTPISDTTSSFSAVNLNSTQTYVALVQNGYSCAIDTSASSTETVDPQSVGGTLMPLETNICIGQNKGANLTLQGNVGNIVDWYTSEDTTHWTGFNPPDTSSVYSISGLLLPTQYEIIVKSGVCPADTSTIAYVNILQTPFPTVFAEPFDTTICYGTTANLNSIISNATSYSFTNTNTLTDEGDGLIQEAPYTINAIAKPGDTTLYVLTVLNSGCPNPLIDTFEVNVLPPIVLSAGDDTAVVLNQPLQLNATANMAGLTYNWSPTTYLSDPNINDPVADITSAIDSIRYMVEATDSIGCTATSQILVRVFTTQPDIFVPSAFTPTVSIDNIFKPILVGIKSLEFFRVYNRYGQLMYSSTDTETGWDGTYQGKLQDVGAYVWMVEGVSYQGKTIFKKGTVVLMR